MTSKVVSVRIDVGLLGKMEGVCKERGIAFNELGKGIWTEWVRRVVDKVEEDRTDEPIKETVTACSEQGVSFLSYYDPSIHKAGDRVLIKIGQRVVEATVPDLDAEGKQIPKVE